MLGTDGPHEISELRDFDPATAHPACVYNVWLSGKDHYAADRAAAAKVIEQRPQVVDGLWLTGSSLGGRCGTWRGATG